MVGNDGSDGRLGRAGNGICGRASDTDNGGKGGSPGIEGRLGSDGRRGNAGRGGSGNASEIASDGKAQRDMDSGESAGCGAGDGSAERAGRSDESCCGHGDGCLLDGGEHFLDDHLDHLAVLTGGVRRELRQARDDEVDDYGGNGNRHTSDGSEKLRRGHAGQEHG